MISLKSFSIFTLVAFLSLPVLSNCDDGKGGIVAVNSEVSILHKGDYQKNIWFFDVLCGFRLKLIPPK